MAVYRLSVTDSESMESASHELISDDSPMTVEGVTNMLHNFYAQFGMDSFKITVHHVELRNPVAAFIATFHVLLEPAHDELLVGMLEEREG
jgi:hypothetical protein